MIKILRVNSLISISLLVFSCGSDTSPEAEKPDHLDIEWDAADDLLRLYSIEINHDNGNNVEAVFQYENNSLVGWIGENSHQTYSLNSDGLVSLAEGYVNGIRNRSVEFEYDSQNRLSYALGKRFNGSSENLTNSVSYTDFKYIGDYHNGTYTVEYIRTFSDDDGISDAPEFHTMEYEDFNMIWYDDTNYEYSDINNPAYYRSGDLDIIRVIYGYPWHEDGYSGGIINPGSFGPFGKQFISSISITDIDDFNFPISYYQVGARTFTFNYGNPKTMDSDGNVSAEIQQLCTGTYLGPNDDIQRDSFCEAVYTYVCVGNYDPDSREVQDLCSAFNSESWGAAKNCPYCN